MRPFRPWQRSYVAYWITMLASGVFLFSCVLSVQGAAQLLPRQIFLRVLILPLGLHRDGVLPMDPVTTPDG